MDYNLVMILIVFVVCFFISSTMNILLKTTSKRDWLMTLLISIGLSLIIVPILTG
ncbi:hypothetical protein [Salimicrobium halophilum]|uniref:hypothetical protein n=1 Tax=Salimicrobium halophilum TaxID=86666 RepID=UPI000B14147A|nr:hypothetical protein [Salimicrobium halophilum]